MWRFIGGGIINKFFSNIKYYIISSSYTTFFSNIKYKNILSINFQYQVYMSMGGVTNRLRFVSVRGERLKNSKSFLSLES